MLTLRQPTPAMLSSYEETARITVITGPGGSLGFSEGRTTYSARHDDNNNGYSEGSSSRDQTNGVGGGGNHNTTHFTAYTTYYQTRNLSGSSNYTTHQFGSTIQGSTGSASISTHSDSNSSFTSLSSSSYSASGETTATISTSLSGRTTSTNTSTSSVITGTYAGTKPTTTTVSANVTITETASASVSYSRLTTTSTSFTVHGGSAWQTLLVPEFTPVVNNWMYVITTGITGGYSRLYDLFFSSSNSVTVEPLTGSTAPGTTSSSSHVTYSFADDTTTTQVYSSTFTTVSYNSDVLPMLIGPSTATTTSTTTADTVTGVTSNFGTATVSFKITTLSSNSGSNTTQGSRITESFFNEELATYTGAGTTGIDLTSLSTQLVQGSPFFSRGFQIQPNLATSDAIYQGLGAFMSMPYPDTLFQNQAVAGDQVRPFFAVTYDGIGSGTFSSAGVSYTVSWGSDAVFSVTSRSGTDSRSFTDSVLGIGDTISVDSTSLAGAYDGLTPVVIGGPARAGGARTITLFGCFNTTNSAGSGSTLATESITTTLGTSDLRAFRPVIAVSASGGTAAYIASVFEMHYNTIQNYLTMQEAL